MCEFQSPKTGQETHFEENEKSLDDVIKEKPTFGLYIQRGLKYLRKEKLQESLTDFSMAAKLKSNSTVAFKNLGIVSAKLGKFEQAVDYFSTAIKTNPKDDLGELLAFRGVALCHLSKFVEASRDFVSTIQRDFDGLWFTATRYCTHDLTFKETKRLNLFLGVDSNIFVNAFDQAIKIENENVDFFHCRGILSLRLKRYPEAIEFLTKAHSLDPKNSYVLSHRSEAFFNIAEMYNESSFLDVQLALKLDENNHSAQCFVGLNHWMKNDFETAVKCFEAVPLDVITSNGLLCVIYNGLALCYDGLEKYDWALKMNIRCLENFPELCIFWYNRGRTYEELRKFDLAIKDYSKCIELNPFFPSAYYDRAWLFQRKKRFQEAIEGYKKAMELVDSNHRYPRHLALCYRDLEEYDLSEKYFLLALELKSDYSIVLRDLGDLYLMKSLLMEKERNKDDEMRALRLLSVRYYSKALVLDKRNRESICERLDIAIREKTLEKTKDEDFCIELYSEVLKYDSKFRQGYVNRAKLLGIRGRFFAAAVDYIKALRCKIFRRYSVIKNEKKEEEKREMNEDVPSSHPIFRILHKIMVMENEEVKEIEKFIRIFCWECYEKMRLEFWDHISKKKQVKNVWIGGDVEDESPLCTMLQPALQMEIILRKMERVSRLRIGNSSSLTSSKKEKSINTSTDFGVWIVDQFCLDINAVFAKNSRKKKEGKISTKKKEKKPRIMMKKNDLEIREKDFVFFSSTCVGRHFMEISQRGGMDTKRDIQERVKFLHPQMTITCKMRKFEIRMCGKMLESVWIFTIIS